MRFSAQDLRKFLEAVKVLADPEAHRHTRDWAEDALARLGPQLVDAYCAAVGIELPIN